MNVKKGNKIKIYQDGKNCRDVLAEILELRAGGIKFKFTIYAGTDDEKEIIAWSRRRRHFHTYEVIGWNYWMYDNCKPEEGSVL